MTSPEDTGSTVDGTVDKTFGDAAGEMANQTEVEAPPAQQDASASAGPAADEPQKTADDTLGSADGATAAAQGRPADTSGVADMVDEGAPVVPPTAPADAGSSDAGSSEASSDGTSSSVEDELAERTSDLQRVSAEYANYRKRVDRDRALVAENATYKALMPIIDVLDTIDRAREHAELDGGFKAVADQLERAVTAAGLQRFGEPGDAFDPMQHEALSHVGTDPEVTQTTCKHIAKSGYRFGDRVVRAAQVLVVDPADG